MKIALEAAKFTLRGSQPAAQGDGDLPLARQYRGAARQDGRADGHARLRSRLRPALLRPDQGLRRIWLPREPRGELRASGLRVELAQMEISGGLRGGAAESQPMGFYAPAQIVRDAREHGVEVREVDVNHSDWDCTLEGRRAAPWPAPGRGVPPRCRRAAGGGRPGRTGRSRNCAAAAACRCMPSSGWPRPTRSARSGSIGAPLCGIHARSSRRWICPCS